MTHPKGALAAVSASMSKAKLHGLFEERKRNSLTSVERVDYSDIRSLPLLRGQ
jgi:hypothetical protein